jgi:hypothetical protein
MTATHSLDSTASDSPVLYLAFELSAGQCREKNERREKMLCERARSDL